MKNVQVIDGADNTAYNIYAVTDEGFDLIFPNGQDIEFVEDFYDRVGEEIAASVLVPMWKRLLKKPEVQGLHGTLFYQLKDEKVDYYPTKRFSDDGSTSF